MLKYKILLIFILVTFSTVLSAQKPIRSQPVDAVRGVPIQRSGVVKFLPSDDVKPIAICVDKNGKWTSTQETCAPCTYSCIQAVIRRVNTQQANSRYQFKQLDFPIGPGIQPRKGAATNTILLNDITVQKIVGALDDAAEQTYVYVCGNGGDITTTVDSSDCKGQILLDVIEFVVSPRGNNPVQGY